MKTRHTIRVAMILVLSSSTIAQPLFAQRSGVLRVSEPREVTRKAAGIALGTVPADFVVSPVDNQALLESRTTLLVDPQLESAMRASANALSMVLVDSLKEARLQLNLSDFLGGASTWLTSGMNLLIASPLDDQKNADLADDHGLVGKARAELTFNYDIVPPATTNQWKLGVTLKGTGARPSYAFREATSLTEHTTTSWEYAVMPGVNLKSARQSLFLGWELGRSHEAQDAQNVCAPAGFGPSGTFTCSDIVVGAPTKKSLSAVRAEAKMAFVRVAVGLAFTHDVDAKKNAVSVPIYFLGSTAAGLAGGVRVGFVSGSESPSVTLFANAFAL